MDKKFVIFRLLHGVAVMFFLLSAYVQINDPDPELWIPMYLVPAFLSVVIIFNPSICESNLIRWLDYVYVFIATILCARTVHENYDQNENFLHWVVHDEAGREFGGLVVVLLWIMFMHDLANLSAKLWVSTVIIAVPCLFWGYIYGNEEFRKRWPQHCQTALYPGQAEMPSMD